MNPLNTGFGFERPWLAIAAIVIIPAAIILAKRLKNPFAASIPLGAPGGVPFKAPINLSGIIKTFLAVEYIGIFLLFASVAGPVVRHAETVWLNRGADIVFVLDVSPSMAALDMEGSNRYNAARKLLREFILRRPADSIGLVAVGSDAAVLVPPTTDRDILLTRLENLQIGEMGDGTAIGMGLAVAAFHLDGSTAPRRAVVLISDGENNAGAVHPETAAAMVSDIGASLYIIGVGTGGEVPLDYTDPFTRVRRTGLFDSRYDAEALRRVSAAGNGTWIPAPTAEALATAFTHVDDQEMVIRRGRVLTRTRSIFRPFMFAALGCIIFARFSRRIFLGDWL